MSWLLHIWRKNPLDRIMGASQSWSGCGTEFLHCPYQEMNPSCPAHSLVMHHLLLMFGLLIRVIKLRRMGWVGHACMRN